MHKWIAISLVMMHLDIEFAHLEQILRDTAKNQAVKPSRNLLSALLATRQSSCLQNFRALLNVLYAMSNSNQ